VVTGKIRLGTLTVHTNQAHVTSPDWPSRRRSGRVPTCPDGVGDADGCALSVDAVTVRSRWCHLGVNMCKLPNTALTLDETAATA
jgi:hypothetical protein